MTANFPYVQLPGAYRGFFRKASLWEGQDHILSVSGSRFNEEYRRYYYRDIQAIVVDKRPRAGSLGWWCLLFALLFPASIASIDNSPPYSWLALVALLLVIAIRFEISVRRSCRCSIQTAVSREPLPSIIRWRDAEKVVNRLHTRITAEQGQLPDEIPTSGGDLSAYILQPDPANASAAQMLEEADARQRAYLAGRGVNFALLATVILLLNALFTLWVSSGRARFPQQSLRSIGYLFMVIGAVPIFLALQNLAAVPIARALRVLLSIMIALSAVRMILGLLGPAQIAILGTAAYANTNVGSQIGLAVVGLLLIAANWQTYRRGDLRSN